MNVDRAGARLLAPLPFHCSPLEIEKQAVTTPMKGNPEGAVAKSVWLMVKFAVYVNENL